VNLGMTMRSHFERAVEGAGGAVSGLASACLANFEDMLSGLQAWFAAEHNPDGTHAAITADSAGIADITALGKLRLGNIVRYELLGVIPTGRLDNVYVAGIETASVLKIRISAAGVTITGIASVGRRQGDLLLLVNDDLHTAGPGPDFTVTAASANSDAENRIIGSLASQSPWTVHGSEGMLLMYDTFSQTGPTDFPGWRVIARC
jgi:hypothetical protein